MILKGRNVYCIDPDYHSDRARFSLTGANPLLAIPQAKERVTFIFNDSNRERYNSYGLAKAHFPKSGESMMLDDLKLSVYPGYEKNLCYLMEIDGLRIVWLTGICDNYLIQKRDISIIKKLHENNIRPDILFLGSPSGIGPELAHGIRETFLEATVLNPKAVFVFGHEPLERKVRYQIERRVKGPLPLLVSENPGDLHPLNTKKEYVKVLHLTEIALKADPMHKSTNKVRLDALNGFKAGTRNLIERIWLNHAIRLCAENLSRMSTKEEQ